MEIIGLAKKVTIYIGESDKWAGKPLYELFGGLKHERLPANASSHVNKKGEAACVAEVVGFFEAGFRSCKLGFAKKGESNIGGDPDTDVSFIRALRAALGDEAEILVDIGNGVRWDVDTAISVANRMAEYRIGWYEEPLYPTDDAGYKKLKANTTVRVASGEREFTEAGYRRQMEMGAVDVYGIDPARVEGARALSGARRTRRRVATAITRASSTLAVTVAVAPIPLADMALLAPLQGLLVTSIAYLSGRPWDRRTALEWVGSVGAVGAAALGLRWGAQQAVKAIPGLGSVVSASIAGAGTLAIGRSAVGYFLRE